jgi:threonine dehydrogenase-like Zn-dependent dehydrogenase
MTTIRVAVIPSPGAQVELREVPEPELEPNSAMLEVQLSEICGTDVHLHRGKLPGVPYPLIPGHVSVGRLNRIRGRLSDVDGNRLREGDIVTFLDVHRTCHACWYCLVAKASTRCPHRRVYGITYGFSDILAGGWAEQIYLRPDTRCIPLELDAVRRFMAGGCGLPTALHAMERADISIGDTVLVLGSGPVGLSSVILASLAGAGRVLCIGGPESRLAVASVVGAHNILNFEKHTEEERINWVRQHSGGRGADVTIEATGSPIAIVQALRATRDAGRVVVVGQYTDNGEVSINPHHDLNRKHLEIRGCWGSDFSHFYRAVQLARDSGRSQMWSHFPLEDFSLRQIQDALEKVARGSVVKALIAPSL